MYIRCARLQQSGEETCGEMGSHCAWVGSSSLASTSLFFGFNRDQDRGFFPGVAIQKAQPMGKIHVSRC